MADYYTEASFIIPCAQEQADIAIKALRRLGDNDEICQLVVSKADDETFDSEEKIIRHCYHHHPDFDDSLKNPEIDWCIEAMLDKNGIWITHNETINTEHAAIFTQSVLLAFDIDALVTIHAAHTCSNPCLDAYGGHAWCVTRHSMRFSSLETFIQAETGAWRGKQQYFLFDFEEKMAITSDKVTTRHGCVLIAAQQENNPETLFAEKLAQFYGVPLRIEGALWRAGDNITLQNINRREINPDEYYTLKKFIPCTTLYA